MESSHKRIEFLDHLRGIAILSVFLFHTLGQAFGRDSLPAGKWFRTLDTSLSFSLLSPLSLGGAGVALFFVISGFCIHLNFRKEGDWGRFFRRRCFRIYPPYLAVLLVLVFLFPMSRLSFASPADTKQFVSHLFLFHNFDPAWFFGINPVFWSIAVEVQLYLLYPVLVALAARIGWLRLGICLAMLETALRSASSLLPLAFGMESPPSGQSHQNW
jgi:peptidoglycan/LPS O-acetylase OafA/YrhL